MPDGRRELGGLDAHAPAARDRSTKTLLAMKWRRRHHDLADRMADPDV